MKYKKYVGNSEYEVMNKLKEELGQDAIILGTRSVRQKGILGFFKKPLVEITVAYEKENNSIETRISDRNLININNQLNDLRKTLEQLSTNMNNKKNLEIHPKLNEYLLKLVENGVEESIATTIMKNLGNQINLDSKDSLAIRNIIEQVLMEYIGKPEPLNLEKNNQKIVFFLGPTGVGKTTTIAKIAAQLVMDKKYEIGLITCDTYRIAAVEQLKVYSDILKIPLEVVYSEDDIYNKLVKFKDKDAIFVDTTGRNHREICEDDEMFKIINSVNNKVIYLVLSGTTDYATLKSIIGHYSFIKDYNIIFTKADEAERLGNILNVRYLTNKSISYVTTGQNVPDDIEILNRSRLVSYLLGEIKYERSSGKS